MLDKEMALPQAINRTYEAHAFNNLRLQLFRLMLVDLWACVLDGNRRTASVRSIVRELRGNAKAIPALKNYYSDATCLTVEVASPAGSLDPEITERVQRQEAERFCREQAESIDRQWSKVDQGGAVLNGIDAKRLIWARHKVVAHFEKSPSGVVAISDTPPFGDGPLRWEEPLVYMASVREYVYSVFTLITANHWSHDFKSVNSFYAKAFWDRFKRGSTELEPP
jgi:hypothetical protein